VTINLLEFPINDEARNDSYIASTGCITSTSKYEKGTSDVSSHLNQASWNRSFEIWLRKSINRL